MSDQTTEEKLVRQVERVATTLNALERRREWSAYAHPWKFLILSFLNGLMVALGSTIGFALVLYLLKALGYLPVIGEFFSFLSNAAGY